MLHYSMLLSRIRTATMQNHPGTKLQYAWTSRKLMATKSWIPTEEELLQKVTTQALIHEVSLEQMHGVQEAVPWFLKNMPASYFRQVPNHLRKSHIKAIAAIRDLNQNDMSLKIESVVNENLTEITIIKTAPKTGLLLAQLKSLPIPENSTLSRIRIFSTADGELALNIFSFEKFNNHNQIESIDDGHRILSYIETMKNEGRLDHSLKTIYADESMREYFNRCSSTYLNNSDPRRFLIQRAMFDKVENTDGTEVHIESYSGNAGPVGLSAGWVTIAAGNVQPHVLLLSTLKILSSYKFDIYRAHLDTVKGSLGGSSFVTMLRLLVSPDPSKATAAAQGPVSSSSTVPTFSVDMDLDKLSTSLRRAKWLDDDVIRLGLVQFPALGLDRAEILLALCGMLHGPLSKQNPYAFASVKSVTQLLGSSPHFMGPATEITTLFMDKFRPGGQAISADKFTEREKVLRGGISKLQHEAARLVLSKLLDATVATLRTNLYMPNRYALSLRVHPSVMAVQPPTAAAPTPFGVFFVHGKNFNAFHCRFRDIARGGLRVVTPPNADQFALESTRHFDEVYGLSLAQQLKNKDIPEGGAKAVILVNSPAVLPEQKSFTIRTAIKAFSDSLLDLITTSGLAGQVDYYRKDELVYLGPDEQVIPSDIDWIVDRAAIRGYPTPAAFMSSKSGAGFNHKEFGVTSEGVCVYLAVALKNSLGINPATQPFTVKITGGPDGDVAGNLIRILVRDYPNTVRILGVADGFGVCEDPQGLSQEELMRLVQQSLPITSFDATKLSSEGVLMDAVSPEGLTRRNTMHFRVKSDAFVPAGGRPNSINGDNWRQFLDEQGRPSSPLIVEGANLFLTPEARDALFKHAGVHIIKDSSANKCGVVTSSCEVAASMLLTSEEFMAVKPALVRDVLDRLRLLASLEAELLFREFRNYPGALPHFSERISNAISKVKDAVTEALADVNPGDPLFQELLPLIRENLPKKLAEMAWERVPKQFPVQYQRNAIASTLASKLVYQEGIHLVEVQPVDQLAHRAFLYYREDCKIQQLLQDLEKTAVNVDMKTRVVDLIRRGGTRTSVQIF